MPLYVVHLKNLHPWAGVAMTVQVLYMLYVPSPDVVPQPCGDAAVVTVHFKCSKDAANVKLTDCQPGSTGIEAIVVALYETNYTSQRVRSRNS